MKLAIVGTHGIPAKYGGFETFAENISTLLVKKGVEVTVYCDFEDKHKRLYSYNGVKLIYQFTSKSKHALLFYGEALIRSLKNNDIILVTGTAGSFFYFLNLFYRRKIITNIDGVESKREKWSKFKKYIIKLSEILSIKFSHHIIADSYGIKDYIIQQYPAKIKEKISVIEYGAIINTTINNDVLKKYGLSYKNYYLVVARLEPENNIHTIIDGYCSNNTQKPLVIVGNLLPNKYVKDLQKRASNNVHFLGGIYNNSELLALRSAAFAYIHGHSVGGTNPSLLEALGSGNICICHDNIFNKEVTANKQLYFFNAQDVYNQIKEVEEMTEDEMIQIERESIKRIQEYYNWENITNKYYHLLYTL